MSKILWISDYSVKQNKGGAQQTNSEMIKAGRKLGHTIRLVTYDSVMPSADSYDLIVINNITKFDKGLIDDLVASGKCVRYEHDHWVAENYPELYKKVNKTIFLSPLHKESIEDKIGYKVKNYEIIPSPIDSKVFKISEDSKEANSVIIVGNLCEDKGLVNLLEYARENPQLKFYAVGWGSGVEELKTLENIEYIGELDRKDLIKYYQRCEYFYHRPVWKEPFGRTVIEAYLCGCSLLVNSNVGAVSWDWDYSNYNKIKKNVQSQSNFWKVLEDEIQSSGDLE